MKTLAALILLALAAAPAAWADGPPQYAAQGGTGILLRNGTRYVAMPATGNRTTLTMEFRDGSLWPGPSYPGSWGIPVVTMRDSGGLSHDGRTMILQSTLTAPTSFMVVGTNRHRVRDRFTLDGNFSFDALSPDASRLYLIQRVDANNVSRYVVRAYDLRTHTLVPGRIADRTQKSWVMQGYPVSRATTPDGRWVYTLYMNPGGYPFVHALDTVKGVAHCVGIPWTKPDQSALMNVVLAAKGNRLDLQWRSGKPWLRVDRTSWQVTPAGDGSGFPWAFLALVPVPLLAWLLWRRRPHGTLLPRQA